MGLEKSCFPPNGSKWHRYSMRPKAMDVVIPQYAEKPGGVGKPPLWRIVEAIANAVFCLTGSG